MIRIVLGALFILLVFMFGYYTGKRKTNTTDKIENQ